MRPHTVLASQPTYQHPDSKPGISALDGLRAVAVLLVLAHHGGVHISSGGFIGVDLFFVLSGFLITALLIHEVDRTGRINLAHFWIRRIRRLFPGLVCMVIVVTGLHSLFAPGARAGLRFDAITALCWVANWRFIYERTNYFTEGIPSPLQHTWSLGVEEQYYLIWPLILVGVCLGYSWWGKRSNSSFTLTHLRISIFLLASFWAVASAVHAMGMANDSTRDRVYFGTDTRIQALLVGAAAAALIVNDWQGMTLGWSMVHTSFTRWLSAWMPFGGLIALGVIAYQATGQAEEFHRGLLIVTALISLSIIVPVSLHQTSLIARTLSWRPLVWLGTISYGIYLWHWPIFLILNSQRTHWSGWWLFLGRCVITIVIAFLSWWLIENPLRYWKPAHLQFFPFMIALTATAIATVIVIVPVGSDPDADIFSSSNIRAAAATASSPTPAPPTTLPIASRRDPHSPLTVSVFGDSIGWTLMHFLPPTPGYRFLDHTVVGCSIVRAGPYRWAGKVIDQKHECEAWPSRWAQQITHDHPDVVLAIIGRWETVDRVNEGRWTHIGDPVFDAYLRSELNRALDILSSTGSNVFIATAPYSRYGERADGSLYPEDRPERVDQWNTILTETISNHPGVHLLDFNKKLSPKGVYTAKINGIKVRSDGVHLTAEGVKWLLPWLEQSLRAPFLDSSSSDHSAQKTP